MFDNLIVSDWMTAEPMTVPPHLSAEAGYEMMLTHDFRRLPVIEAGRLVGIVSLSDMRQVLDSPQFHTLTMGDIMTPDVMTVQETELIRNVAIIMFDQKIGGVPVVNANGHLVGIITESDLLRVLIEAE